MASLPILVTLPSGASETSHLLFDPKSASRQKQLTIKEQVWTEKTGLRIQFHHIRGSEVTKNRLHPDSKAKNAECFEKLCKNFYLGIMNYSKLQEVIILLMKKRLCERKKVRNTFLLLTYFQNYNDSDRNPCRTKHTKIY